MVKSFHKYMISLFRVSFLYFSDKLFILINQFNNLDLTIERKYLKTYRVSNLGEGKLQISDFSVLIF